MTYRIVRNGQMYGPYSPAEVESYLASGNIVPSDLAQAEGSAEWVPVSQLFPARAPRGFGYSPAGYVPMPGGATPSYPGAIPANFNPQLYPDPPDLPWWLALILGLVTGGVFFVVWDIVQAAWLRRIEQSSIALYLYVAAAVLFAISFTASWHSIGYYMFHRPMWVAPHHTWFGPGRWLLWLAARFVMRSDLLRHYNTAEPIGLRLSGFLTFLFGGLYFQYHFNQINEIKRSLRVGVAAV